MLIDREKKIAFLLRYGQMKERVVILLERRKAYEDDVYGIKSPILSDLPKGGGIKSDMSDKVIKLLTLTEDIDNEIEDLHNKMNYIKTCIKRLNNYRYLSVIEMKYIDGLQRKQIAGMLSFTVMGVDSLVRKAIKVLPITQEDLEKVI